MAAERSPWLNQVDRILGGDGEVPLGLVAQFRRNLPLYAIGAFAVAIQQLLMAKRDFLVKGAVDAIAADQSDLAASSAAWMLAVSVSAMAARTVSRISVFTGGRNVEYELRNGLLKHLQRLGPSFFGTIATGDIMSRATNDLHQVRLLLGFGILSLVSAIFSLMSALYVMVSINGTLTIAALATFPLMVLAMRAFSGALYARNQENQKAIGAMSARVLASLSGVRVVRSFAMEDSEIAAFEVANAAYLKKSLRLALVRGSMWPVMGTVSALGVVVVFWYGGTLLIEDPNFTTGDFVAFWMALLRLVWPMMALGFVTSVVQRGRASYHRLQAIFDTNPEIVDGDQPAPALVEGALRVHDLHFSFDDHDVLRGVSFEVPAGTSLAILGRTGSGKSTLAALLPRLLPAQPGSVFLDGTDVCDLPVEIVRASIGYAQQDAFLFSNTVEQNIGYVLDDPESQRALIESAAREAQVFDDILGLPDGFETVVGERGVQLSGGQKQRVALARALIREPPILVLDDPLSAVDAKTEAAILQAIDRQADARTVLLITHRVAAAARCDQVIVIEKGRVIERGTHAELLEAGGLYALFAEEQQMQEALAAIGVDTPPTGPSSGPEAERA